MRKKIHLINSKNSCFPRSEVIHIQNTSNHNTDTFGTFPYAKEYTTGTSQKRGNEKERNGSLNLASQELEKHLVCIQLSTYQQGSHLFYSFFILLKLLSFVISIFFQD